MQISVTVAICTWNRAALLDQTLGRMKCLEIPEGVTWELLVVNNNCSDNTDEIIQKHAPVLPLKRLFEPKQGHSNARNCAVQHASGDLLVWTDDDVLVDKNWLALFANAATLFSHAAYFGGAIEPYFETAPPRDLARSLPEIASAYALVDYGNETRPFRNGESPFGANMAFRMDVLRSFQFDPNLGRVENNMIGDDETALLERLKSDKQQGIWIGQARVQHIIPEERATWSYIERYYSGLGQTVTRRQGFPDCSTIFGAPRWVVREYWTKRLQGWFLRCLGQSGWVAKFARAAYYRGVIEEIARYREKGGISVNGYLVPPGAGIL
ncbi:MAG: glycosyltransferase [Gemmatales bacterium]